MKHFEEDLEVAKHTLRLTANTVQIIALTNCLFSCQQQLLQEHELVFEEILLNLKKANQLNIKTMTLAYRAKQICLAGNESMLKVNPCNLSGHNYFDYSDIAEKLLDYEEDDDVIMELEEYYPLFETPKINHLWKKADKVLSKWLEIERKSCRYVFKTDDMFDPKAKIDRLERLYKEF